MGSRGCLTLALRRFHDRRYIVFAKELSPPWLGCQLQHPSGCWRNVGNARASSVLPVLRNGARRTWPRSAEPVWAMPRRNRRWHIACRVVTERAKERWPEKPREGARPSGCSRPPPLWWRLRSLANLDFEGW